MENTNIGNRLKSLRQARRLTLNQVAKRSGLSESFLSQVERSQANASIASLQRISAALNSSMHGLFASDQRNGRKVLRREDLPSLKFGILGRKLLLSQEPLENLEVLMGEFEEGGSTGDEPYSHGDSEEMLVVLSGKVRLIVDEIEHELGPEDSITYRSGTPHKLSNIGEGVAKVIWIISPPSY